MDKIMKWTILGTVAGVILAFNMYHADYKLLIAQVGTIALATMVLIKCSRKACFAVNRSCKPWFASIWQSKLCSYTVLKNPMILFLAVCALSFLLSPHKLASGQELYKVGTWIVFGIIVAAELALREKREAKQALQLQIVNVWLICTAIVCIYGIAQFFGVDFMELRLQHNRIVSTFGNATVFAGFLAMTLPVAIANALDKNKCSCKPWFANISQSKLCSYGLILLILYALLLTRSRAGIFAGAVGIFILFLQLRVAANLGLPAKLALPAYRKASFAATIGLILVLLIIPFTRNIIFDTILRKTSRLDIWSGVLQLIRTNPILGTGIGTFSMYFPNFASESILKTHFIGVEYINHAHSEYLEILSEMGIVGLAAFLFVIYRSCKACFAPMPQTKVCSYSISQSKLCSYTPGFFAAFIVVLLNNLFGVDLRYTSTGMFFWMIASIIARPKAEAISEIASSPAFGEAPRNDIKRFAFSTIIIIAALSAIYFTIKPYTLIKGAHEQDFFAKDTEAVDKKISKMDALAQKDADDFFKMGVLYAKKKDFQKATDYFYKTLEINPMHAGAYNNLGNLTVEAGDIESARKYFGKAVEMEPKNIDYLLNLASACFLLNKLEESEQAVEKVLKIEPANSRALLLQRQMRQ